MSRPLLESKVRLLALLVIIGMVVAACGDSDGASGSTAASDDGGTATTIPGEESTTSAALTTTSSDESCGDHTFRISHGSPETSTWQTWAVTFADQAEAASDGRIQMEIFPSAQLFSGNPVEEQQGMIEGVVDAQLTSTIILALTQDPRFDLFNMPFTFESLDVANEVVDGPVGQLATEWVDELGIAVPVGFGVNGFRQITNSKKPITEPADLDGLRFRVAGSKLFLRTFELLGADPLTMPFGEVFAALQQGTVDGQENPLSIIESASLYEVQDYVSLWNYVYDPLILLFNQDSWASLCPSDQQILRDAAEAAKVAQRAEETELTQSLPTTLATEDGMTVTSTDEIDIEAFQAAVAPIRDEWADIVGQDNLALLDSEVEKASG